MFGGRYLFAAIRFSGALCRDQSTRSIVQKNDVRSHLTRSVSKLVLRSFPREEEAFGRAGRHRAFGHVKTSQGLAPPHGGRTLNERDVCASFRKTSGAAGQKEERDYDESVVRVHDVHDLVWMFVGTEARIVRMFR